MKPLTASFSALAVILCAQMPAAARADDEVLPARDGLILLGGIGHAWLTGNERVYDAAGKRISHLIWESRVPVFTFEADAGFLDNWRLMGNATFALAGNSHMENYDWLAPYGGSSFDDWSHRSIHPNTKLDRYLDLDIAVGRDLRISPSAILNLHAGFKYTNVEWTARGGSYVYSIGGYRNATGDFPDEAVIGYEQRFPGIFIGGEATARSGDWTFSGLLRGGVTLGADGIDHHWLRQLRFDDAFGPRSFLSLGARLDRATGEMTSLFLAGNFDRYFRSRGDTTIRSIPTGATLAGPFEDGAGMDLSAFRLSAGLKLRF